MIVLTETTDTLQVVLAGTVTTNQLTCIASWRDVTTTTYTPGRSLAVTNDTTDVTLVAAPAASTQRLVDLLQVYNADTTPEAATVKFDANGTEYILWSGTLGAGAWVAYHDGTGWVTSA